MSIYHKDVSHLKTIDPYRLQELYKMHPCAEHVVKKLLVAGDRTGGKSLDEDIADSIWTLQRWQEMRAEDAAMRFELVEVTADSDPGQRFEVATPGKVPLYDWRGVAGHFNWLASNPDGVIMGFSVRPVRDSFGWVMTSGSCAPVDTSTTSAVMAWADSLEARPE
jgi:hypothetical protein